MAFWSSQRIKREQQNGINLIQPFNLEHVHQGAYELSLSDEVLTTPTSAGASAVEGNVLMIRPGQFGLLYTTERVRIPANVIAFISIKASKKLDGLVNISGFHVDPGYSGRLKFSVYNAGSETIPLQFGEPAFLIWFSDLDQATEDPYGAPHQHVNQRGITPQDRVRMNKPVPSPTALDERLRQLETRWRIFVATGKYILLPLVAGVIAGLILWFLTSVLPAWKNRDATSKNKPHADDHQPEVQRSP